MKKAILFGAGNIGRGFLGQLLSFSGYEIVFVDIDNFLVDLLNQHRKYHLEIVSSSPYRIEIINVRAINAKEKEKIAEEIVTSEIIVSAVGSNVIKFIIDTIAQGIIKRYESNITTPINILICENLYDAANIFRKMLQNAVPVKYKEYINSKVGLVETVIGRMVPIMTTEEKKKEPLLIKVEAFCELPVDKNGFIGEIPQIINMLPSDNFLSYVDRKLYTHNCGHAICAYLGHYKHYTYIFEAIQDFWVKEKVKMVMIDETGKALIKKHNLDPIKHKNHIMDLINRFGNKALGDTIYRVAKDPIRKLSHNDRLIGAANLCLEYDIIPENIALAIAYALKYFSPDDNESVKLKELIENKGIEKVLKEICKIDINGKLAKLIKEKYENS